MDVPACVAGGRKGCPSDKISGMTGSSSEDLDVDVATDASSVFELDLLEEGLGSGAPGPPGSRSVAYPLMLPSILAHRPPFEDVGKFPGANLSPVE